MWGKNRHIYVKKPVSYLCGGKKPVSYLCKKKPCHIYVKKNRVIFM